jgi:DNA-binding NarL/FixJ family response regulator
MVAGVTGYLLKRSSEPALVHAALMLIGRFGATVIDPVIVHHFHTQASGTLSITMPGPAARILSERERRVLSLLADGASDKIIAAQLGVQRTTVETYIIRLRAKLGAESRAHLIAIAARQGLLPP